MAQIAWSITTPGDDMTASAVDDQIRSDLTAIQTGLQQFMYWDDGSANSDGEFKADTLRIEAISDATNPATLYGLGWLKWNSLTTTSQSGGPRGGGLYLMTGGQDIGSGYTTPVQVGGRFMSEMSTPPSSVSYRWERSSGTFTDLLLGGIVNESVITFGVEYSHQSAVNVYVNWIDGGGGIASLETFAFGVDQVSKQSARVVAWMDTSLLQLTTGYWAWMSEGTAEVAHG